MFYSLTTVTLKYLLCFEFKIFFLVSSIIYFISYCVGEVDEKNCLHFEVFVKHAALS